MAELGKINTLNIASESEHGVYLDGGELGDILLPNTFVPKAITPNTKLSVFVHLDSEDRIVATTETPHAQVGQFAALKVVDVNRRMGAFLDWGLSKDLLLPFRESRGHIDPGQTRVVFVYVDNASGRIVASERHGRFLSQDRPRYQPQQEVDLLVASRTPLGYKAIINNQHSGLLYENELSSPLSIGMALKGYVKKVRADGSVDLRRDRSGYDRVAPLADRILEAVESNGGRLELDDRSPPEDIRDAFGSSKKAFKQALGNLYKQRLIEFSEGGVIRAQPQQ